MATATIKMNPAEWARWLKRLGPKFNAAANAGARMTAMRAVGDLQRATSRKRVMDTGFYKRAWTWAVLGAGAMQTIGAGVTVYNASPYAGVIEHGRRPGARPPPTKAIAAWVKRKVMRRRKRKDDNEANAIAFLIARKIAKDGLPAENVLGDYIPKLTKIFMLELRRAMARAWKGTK